MKSKLISLIREVKRIPEDKALILAQAVLEEAKATLHPRGDVFRLENVGVTMGDFGVGSRGSGDFYTHTKIAEVIGRTDAVVDSRQLDDSGVVKANGQYITVTVDGMHSRLSDYPFLAGFHVTRAALRDVYVMGAKPVALLSDIHLADDGDVSKLFDHIAGIATVSELIGVPLITGSTLRIGGDMVIGDRLTGCVGAVGVSDKLTPRKSARPGDVIMMSEGAGGGTVCSAALYYDRHEVVEETLNIKFLEACEALLKEDLTIHAMTDVTNGGIRGDAKEISYTAGVKLHLRGGEDAPPGQSAGFGDARRPVDRLSGRLHRCPAHNRSRGRGERDRPDHWQKQAWRWMRSARSRQERAHCCIWTARLLTFPRASGKLPTRP